MRVLVACEYSQIVTKAFRDKGHEAFSCDILPTEGNPDWHYQGDVLEIINDNWDMMIAFPPCTYLSYVGNRHWNKPGRDVLRGEGADFFMKMINAPIDKICVENPLGVMSKWYKKPDQTIHPYYFGEPFQKRTCLWLKRLPLLEYAFENNLFMKKTSVDKPKPVYYLRTTGKAIHYIEAIKGSKKRSKFWPSVASAMAEQWRGEKG